ncbi:MAG: TVP38/TMEM64 family protein [Alphaproteobacteria bacterium]|jgi:uncharacterized membrane protein YdjX (TVP38/TMEM64 family)|nr:TVP38/TMEM64 family protein [Alphaproteobacteria bacterium]MDP6564603.1 TVP38/TMEM64 family protein [Alphaproteobacteria bacterium]MDP6814536.1 TVP38/TMEM64 family protein [Alphaproteobacteria bacterium]
MIDGAEEQAAGEGAGKASGPPLLSFRRLWPLLVLAAGFVAFFLFGGDDLMTFETLRNHRATLAGWIAQHGLAMAVGYVVVYAVVVAFSLPGGAVMTITGGFLFGSVQATALVVVGATIGATIIFLAAKTALGDPLRAKAGPALRKMEDGFRDNAFNYLLVLRLIPLFPFFLVNLVPAFLGMRLRDYVLATFIGIIPASFVFAQVGTGLDSIFASGEEPSLDMIMTPDVLTAMLGLAVLAALPLLYKAIRAVRGRRA